MNKIFVYGTLLKGLESNSALASSKVDHPAAPGTTNKLPAGDTHVAYLGPNGPWPSARFEAHSIVEYQKVRKERLV